MPIDPGGTTISPYDFVVGLAGNQVVILGNSGGNVRCKGGRKIKLSCGPGVTAFTITCTDFPDNGERPVPVWPFAEDDPAGAVTEFNGTLKKPEKGAGILIFKYTISVAGKTDADPIIIVDH
jgi:hypothetical protein